MAGRLSPTRAPYLATVTARVCHCRQAPMELGRAATMGKARTIIEGYWNFYLGFFGDQVMWLDWQIVDTRDGRVMWRNGRPLMKEEEAHGLIAE